MDTELLVQRLGERGIKLSVSEGKLTCDSEQPIPKAILTTINAEEQQLLEYLKGAAAPVLEAPAANGTYRPAAPQAEARPRYVRPPVNESDTGIPRLPWQLERLVSAASSGQLHVELSGITDPTHYVLGWACSYLTGDRAEALRRLWEVRRAWQPEGAN